MLIGKSITCVLAVCAVFALVACQEKPEQLTSSIVEQIASDTIDQSELNSEVSQLQSRLDQLEQRVTEMERERDRVAASSTSNSASARYRLIGGSERADYSTQSRCMAAKETIESDYRVRQAAAGRSIIFSPPQLSCIPVG